MLLAGSELRLGSDVHGMHIVSLAARFNSDYVTFHAFWAAWEEPMLHLSIAFSTIAI